MAAEPITLMAHLVAGYPYASGCRAAARGLVEGGAAYLEVQIPFSDPSADGPSIRDACSASLAAGCTVADALALVAELRAAHPGVPVFVMAYASLVATPGAAAFAAAAARAGAAGLIVPDLPFDADEGLSAACAGTGLSSVPVAAPSMRPERLSAMAGLGRPYLYAALRAGITGAATTVGEDTKRFLSAAGEGGSKVLGGFGIRTGEQARAVAPYVHAVVAGSVFVDAIARAAAEAERAGAQAADRDALIREATRRAAREIVD
jgi:tryptophan synthase alpha chain